MLALVAAACGEDAAEPSGGGEPPVVYDAIGEGEGQLKLIAWHGYTEDGTTEGYEEYDWVTPFEDETGCDVTVTYGDSSDEMVQLMRSGGGSEYDGVSASGDASNRLIAGGDVGAVDPSLFPEMENVIAPLNPDGGTKTNHYIVGDNVYGTPYMYGPNFLMYNANEVSPAPTSWDVTFESDSPYAGKVTAYDSPIFIADAAMYLMAHQPDLGITDPYELTQEQFDAAVELLKQQNRADQFLLDALHRRDRRVLGRLDGGRHGVAGELHVHEGPRGRQRGSCHPVGRGDRLGRHVDDLGERSAPQLHAQVDGLDAPARRAGRGRDLLRGRWLQRGLVRRRSPASSGRAARNS